MAASRDWFQKGPAEIARRDQTLAEAIARLKRCKGFVLVTAEIEDGAEEGEIFCVGSLDASMMSDVAIVMSEALTQLVIDMHAMPSDEEIEESP